MKIRILLSMILAVPLLSHAEDAPVVPTLCSTEVSYRWRPSVEPSLAPATAEPTKEGGGAKDPLQVGYYSRVEGKGESEEIAKQALEMLLPKVKNQAIGACREAHENQARCLANKFASVAPVFNSLSFAGRKDLEASISKDCEKVSGTCIDTVSADPKCVVLPVVAEAPAGDGKGGDKDKEKGKEKKK